MYMVQGKSKQRGIGSSLLIWGRFSRVILLPLSHEKRMGRPGTSDSIISLFAQHSNPRLVVRGPSQSQKCRIVADGVRHYIDYHRSGTLWLLIAVSNPPPRESRANSMWLPIAAFLLIHAEFREWIIQLYNFLEILKRWKLKVSIPPILNGLNPQEAYFTRYIL